MVDNSASHAVQRAHLLGKATAAQQGLSQENPLDFWYRQGVRDAYAYAAALTVTGDAAAATRAAADRVIALLRDGVTDIGVLVDATDLTPRPASPLRWVGQLAFDHAAKDQSGIDHDLGSRWGPRQDIRISHRRADGAPTGLLYAFDRTWDEYAILDPAAPVDVVDRAYRAALAADSHLSPDQFLGLLRASSIQPAAWPEAPGVQL